MTVTLLEVVQRICRHVGLDPSVTAFSDDDETNDLVQYINEAYEHLLADLPKATPYLNQTASLNTADGTRLYDLAATAHAADVYEWSIAHEPEGDETIRLVTKDFVDALSRQWDEATGKPEYAYFEGQDQIGFYPVPDDIYTITYEYARHLTSRLSATTDTFVIPDHWVLYLEAEAQAAYERAKGYDSVKATEQRAMNLYADVMAEALALNPAYFLSEDF